uniref:Uncharacterized protein n=1 Tax=Siphoviridae sp. cteNz1 TaxID=2826404 RepID=A0A8S5N6K6_9CAUD|nr:MAG TPA: hypothetical protein [Siphoviridae sp. cteNz1]
MHTKKRRSKNEVKKTRIKKSLLTRLHVWVKGLE